MDEDTGDPDVKADRPPAGQPGEKIGYPSMAEQTRKMREELGGTAGCQACAMAGVWGHGLRHNAACKKRRADWMAKVPPTEPRAEPKGRGRACLDGESVPRPSF